MQLCQCVTLSLGSQKRVLTVTHSHSLPSHREALHEVKSADMSALDLLERLGITGMYV